jgi:SNF2 family DNA or RNA helicase
VANWAKEFDKWLGKASQPKRVVVKKGGKEGLHQIKAFGKVKPNQSEVLILSYELFRMNAQHFQQIQKVGLLVVDEGHRLKNTAGSLTLTALESLPCDARLCITATPIQNILSDFFNLANFVCPGLLGDLSTFRKGRKASNLLPFVVLYRSLTLFRSYSGILSEYERPISASNNKNCSAEQKRRGLAQSRILDEITRSFMLRRLQKDVLKSMLPPRSEVLLFCRPTNVQGKLYKQITSQQRGASLGVTADALTTLTKLRKLCSHPALLEDSKKSRSSNDVDIALSGKLTLLNQLLSQIQQQTPEDKVVIVSNFTSALSVIEHSILKPHNLTYLRLDGTTELSNRQAIVDTFNKTSSQRNFAFLLSSKAGGCGLNLIGGMYVLTVGYQESFMLFLSSNLPLSLIRLFLDAANRLVMFDPDWYVLSNRYVGLS